MEKKKFVLILILDWWMFWIHRERDELVAALCAARASQQEAQEKEWSACLQVKQVVEMAEEANLHKARVRETLSSFTAQPSALLAFQEKKRSLLCCLSLARRQRHNVSNCQESCCDTGSRWSGKHTPWKRDWHRPERKAGLRSTNRRRSWCGL